MHGIGRRGAALLLGPALCATGCTGSGRDAGPPGPTRAPPATRSPASGKACLQAGERATAFHFRAGQGFDTVFGDLDAGAAVGRLRVPALFMAAREDGPFADAARAVLRRFVAAHLGPTA